MKRALSTSLLFLSAVVASRVAQADDAAASGGASASTDLPSTVRVRASSGGAELGPGASAHPAAATSAASEREASEASEASARGRPPLVELHGYVQPQFGARHYPSALPADRWQYGGLSSRAGLIVSGSPAEDWSYVLHLSVDARTLQVVTGVDLVDTDGDGSAEGLGLSRRASAATIFEEVAIAYRPLSFLSLKLGAMRVPFTVALRSVNTALMFPNRPGPNEVFQSGSDQGILASGEWLDGRLQASAGVFTGTSLGLLPANTESRGFLYSARVDGNPLGRLPEAETDFSRGKLRFGVGVGALYRTGTLFTRTGYELAELDDMRVSASVRVAFYGLFLQAEALRRLATDNVSSRPDQATGAYAQASFFFPLSRRVGLAPIGRVGFSTEEERVLPRRTVYLEGGLSIFPSTDGPRPESVRVLVQYIGENRVFEQERAHGAILQGQLIF